MTTSQTHQTLSQRLQAVARRKRVTAVTFIAVIAIGAPFVQGLPSLYRASAMLLVKSSEQSIAPASEGEVDARLQSIKQEALGRARLTDLLDRFHLYPSLRGRVPTPLLLQQLQSDIKIDPVSTDSSAQRRTIAFKITYTGRDPETVAAVTN